jgi:purine-binding chemotaxis protein CheW
MPKALLDVVVFTLDDVRYGIAAAHVVEVVRAVAVTPLPGLPPVVQGVIDYRGGLVPVFDTRARFGHAPREERLEDHFVLVRAGERTAALRADHADRIEAVDATRIEDPARQVAQVEHVAGVARLDDGLLLVHDPERFLAAAEQEALAAALSERARAEAGPYAHAGEATR